MQTLRHSFISLLSSPVAPLRLRPISFLSFPLFPKPKPPSPLFLNPKSQMSNRPNAFDVLKSNAKAAYKKKLTQSQPSPTKKRKSPEPEIPKPVSGPTDSAKLPESDDNHGGVSSIEPAKTSDGGPASFFSSKKTRSDGKLEELKGKIGELKKKAKDFDPRKVACWDKGEKIPFIFVSLAFDMIANESGRIVITDIVCNMLRTVMETTPDDLLPVVYLLANKIAPAHEGIELGIGEAILIKALAEAYSKMERDVKKMYQEMGDLGLVAKASRRTQRTMSQPEQLTVTKVFDTFRLIAKQSGKDSQESKRKHIKGLLVAAIDCEPQYIMRLLQSKLRIGFSEQTLLAALGQASVYIEKHSKLPSHVKSPLEEAVQIVKGVYSVLPVYDIIVPALLNNGVWNLSKTCNLVPGVPVAPMLAKSTKAVSEIVNKFQDIEFTCEYKYDGERAQIHYTEDGSVEIYSRNAERNTGKFPDVVATISRLKKSSVQSFILDCELVAYDREKKKILPFQILSTRARKNVVVSEIKIDVCIFAFDILYLNGEPLIQEQLEVRRERLYSSFEVEPGFFQYATALTSNDLEEIQKFLNAAVDSSSEGLIIKTLNKDATYEPSKRSRNWLKLKKDYMESLGDSFDLVPIGAFHGTGKRTGFYGAFLLACYDNDNEEYQTICKLGTGFSEAQLEEHSTRLRTKVITEPKSYYRFGDKLTPDVWFEPSEVWEVKAADLTISPVHCAAIGSVDPNKGISLRFPRMLRVRTDKTPEEASSAEQVAEMYNAQKHNQPNPDADDEDD
ncbi:DNA ligase 1 [Linum perenne]